MYSSPFNAMKDSRNSKQDSKAGLSRGESHRLLLSNNREDVGSKQQENKLLERKFSLIPFARKDSSEETEEEFKTDLNENNAFQAISLNRNSNTNTDVEQGTISTQPRAVLPVNVIAVENDEIQVKDKRFNESSDEEETNYEDDNDFEPFETSTKDFNKKSNTASSKSGPENKTKPSILQKGRS